MYVSWGTHVAFCRALRLTSGSVLGHLLFIIFINDLCDVINHSNCLLFADDLKIYRAVSSPSDCFLLQSEIDCVHKLLLLLLLLLLLWLATIQSRTFCLLVCYLRT
jgi:hypothetical protein